MYDVNKKYTPTFFRGLKPTELQILFEEARKASFGPVGFKLVRKITKDISSMRLLLKGFDSHYNEVHR